MMFCVYYSPVEGNKRTIQVRKDKNNTPEEEQKVNEEEGNICACVTFHAVEVF